MKIPPQAPRANACEQWVPTVRTECLDRTLIWNRHHLEQVLIRYLDHYNTAARIAGSACRLRSVPQPRR